MYIKKSKWISIVMKNAIFNFVAESLYWEQNENSIKLNKTVSWSIKDFNIISIMLSSLHFFDENSKIPIEKGIQIFEKTFLNFFKIWKEGQNKIYSVNIKIWIFCILIQQKERVLMKNERYIYGLIVYIRMYLSTGYLKSQLRVQSIVTVKEYQKK